MVNSILAGVRDFLLIILMLVLIAGSIMLKGYFDEVSARWERATTVDQACVLDPEAPGC
ncbi:hypothetical protein [Paractinoplanes hotanensis]|uniref:Uncharacterized protein n=1 Tax=Paractinoplanes hotanensis TaxID=2906497 RepID=A0ABT0Y2Z8_9ACTN|nr:hypothetical protein [Actinoplanes hotanensis]MCM4080398.1 hypothetical protein [Actinoplanes hotanensis]